MASHMAPDRYNHLEDIPRPELLDDRGGFAEGVLADGYIRTPEALAEPEAESQDSVGTDPLAPARGVTYGAIIGFIFWVILLWMFV